MEERQPTKKVRDTFMQKCPEHSCSISPSMNADDIERMTHNIYNDLKDIVENLKDATYILK